MSELASHYDLVVVGGGINGVGIARDAAGRGLSVLTLERDDLAQATSSASTKLIHGGLRYLEHYEFRLVREALKEREILLRSAPHIIRPLTFLLPHNANLRPRWMIRAGLFLYDHLARRERLPGSGSVAIARHPAGQVLKPEITQGFHYSDCWVDDARLVVLNAMDAQARGATILTRTPFLGAERQDEVWEVRLRQGGRLRRVKARALVNAAGPWVTEVLRACERVGGEQGKQRVRLVKGSHIVVRRPLASDDAFIFQHGDGRIVFAIPYEGAFTLIGTTDVAYKGDLAAVSIDDAEVEYLLSVVNAYFAKPLARADVVWHYAGVRPLYDDGEENASAVTRDYTFDLDAPDGAAPLLSIFGGKITTYRKLAEHALEKLLPALRHTAPAWTGKAMLPGGDLGPQASDAAAFAERLGAEYPWLPRPMAQRLARSYGSLSCEILASARGLSDLGCEVAPGLYEAELDYLRRQEWARSAEDVLWRRSKLGLHLGPKAAEAIDAWLSELAA